MGDTRATVRTLPSGERVTHHPPSDLHPEGKMVLIPAHAAKARHAVTRATNRARHAVLKAVHIQRITVKKGQLKANRWPSEKSPI